MENVMAKWAIDPNHSQVQFKVKHLGIANVSGTFKIFKGEVKTASEDFSNAEINFEVDANSIYTNLEERDNQLRSAIFFDTEKFPKLIFNGLLQKKGDKHELVGDLTIRDTKRPVKLEVEMTGSGVGRFGDIRTGFEVNGKINRKDFGLTFSMATEAGSLIVGEEVKLHFDVELIKQVN